MQERYAVRMPFRAFEREYRTGEVRAFEEWPDDEREAEIEWRLARGHIAPEIPPGGVPAQPMGAFTFPANLNQSNSGQAQHVAA